MNSPVTEGSPVTVTVEVWKTLSNDVTIPLRVARITSEDGDHGTLSSLTIKAGSSSAVGTITTTRDDDTDDERFLVRLGTLPPGMMAADILGSGGSVVIKDLDTSPTVVWLSMNSPVTEGSPVTVSVEVSKTLSNDVTIPLRVARITSEDGDHGTLSSLTIKAGSWSAVGTITTTRDDDTDDERFLVRLGTLPPGMTALDALGSGGLGGNR